MRICIVQPTLNAASETFLRAHAERLPGVVAVVHRGTGGLPAIDNKPILSQSTPIRAARKLKRFTSNRHWDWEITSAYIAAFRRLKCDVVLAQYGSTGVAIMEACRLANVPLVVHFHGYDASRHDVLHRFQSAYPELFGQAAAIVGVSIPMCHRLIELGAPQHVVHLNHYGVDVERFTAASPGTTPATFLAIGRLVDKKAPHLTLLAFAKVRQCYPAARLRIIGDGPLRGICEDLIRCLGLQESVDLLGTTSHEHVAQALREARSFVQHSVEAHDGDCEGLPNSILEASASALPVIATRHAGIPESVIHGESGLLVAERDIDGFANAMLELATNPSRAHEMGSRGREIMCESFRIDHSVERLRAIIEAACKYKTFRLGTS